MLQRDLPEDSYLHKGMRAQLIGKLRDMGIKDERVLMAMNAVPRHFFLDTAFQHIAYENRAFQILAQQTISHPFTVAFQTELLQVKKFDKVLEIGTGSAYQSCVLAELGAQVFTIERQRALYDHIGKFSYLKKYPSIKRFYGDGYAGLPSYAPFDKVIVTAGAPFVPDALTQQLKPGGILVIPVGDGGGQRMLRITKEIDHKLKADDLGPFEFVPMLEGKNK
jgi:protein-L-isoaspartate(D-aspartate) O-methyltransferase